MKVTTYIPKSYLIFFILVFNLLISKALLAGTVKVAVA